jgi:WhiB family redox-sensing transcriptional regulator
VSRFKTPSSAGWITSYTWIGEPEFLGTDSVDLDSWRWQAEAACRGADSEAFFETESSADRHYLAGICRPCPVREACLAHALDRDEHGWWGGTTRSERRRMKGD